MYAYYRTSCHSTVNQKILRGSFSNNDSSDLILIKGNSLEWMSIGLVTESDPHLLTRQLQQSTFGMINDTQVLRCLFTDLEDNKATITTEEEFYEDIPYSKKIRNHSMIQGQDVIVALSEYGKLVFITIHSDSDLDVKRFETLAEVYLDSPGLEYTKVGKKLAVDPYSRAIAVGSFQDNFDILILNETMSRVKFDPIIGRGSECEVGIIWHMEFLHTETTSMERIVLALVIYNDIDRSCRIVVYAIDASNIENVTIEKIGRLPLERNTPLPLLLIPLKFQPEAFLLVTEQQVCLMTAEDLTCGNVLYPTSYIPKPFGSGECPLFTACASHLDPTEEYIYLGSAEGSLYRLEVSDIGEMTWVAIQQTNHISQSMCMLGTMNMIDQNNEVNNADIILYSGESADSQVIAIPRSQSVDRPTIRHTVLQSLVNRAPLTDFQVADDFRDHQDALIACSGQDKHGSLSIITHGIETSALHASNQEWNGISRMWNLTVTSSNMDQVPCLIASSTIDTHLLCAKDGHIKDITTSSNIAFNTETVYASTINLKDRQVLLQIHPKGLLIMEINYEVHDLESADILAQWKPEADMDYRIELATSWHDDADIYIAVCIMKEDAFILQVLSVEYKDMQSSSNPLFLREDCSIKMDTCPSYIGHFHIRSRSVLAVGTFEPSLLFYSVKNNTIQNNQTFDLSCLSPGQFTVPHSAAIIHSSTNEPLYFLLGLRQGSILSFKVDSNDLIVCNGRPHLHNIGSRAVRLSPQYQSRSAVYALSEQLWRLTCFDSKQLEMEHILLPKFNNSIDAFAPFDCDLPLLHTTGEPLAVVADGKLQVFQLGLKSQTNTYKINLGETPRKVIYDKELDYIITITTSMESGERTNSMRLVDPSSGQPLADSQLLWTGSDYGRSDMVLSTAEWNVENNGKLYKYLCIGIGHPREPFHSFRSGMSARVSETLMNKGTLLLFRLKTKPNKASGFTLSRVWAQDKLPGGVFAIRPHPAGLLFSAGRHLYLYRLVNGRLVEVAHEPLRFTITSIHEDGDRICVTSHTDSLSFYQFDPETSTLEFLKSDVVARSIHHSLMLNSRLAVGVSQSGGMIALYDDPNDKSFESRLQCLFSFHYPDIIIKPSLALLRSQHDLDSEADLLAKHLVPWSQEIEAEKAIDTIASVPVKPIVGCTVSGGIIHVYRITSALYTLLYTLQNILIEFGPTSPLLGSVRDFKKWYCGLSGGEKATIHGDLIESYLRLSPEDQLSVIQNEAGEIKSELLEAIQLLFEDVNNDSMVEEEDINLDNQNPVILLKDILSGFEKYR